MIRPSAGKSAGFVPGDYVVIACTRDWGFRGIRCRVSARGVRLARTAEEPASDAPLADRLGRIGRELGVSRGGYLYFTGDPAGGCYFECRTVDLPRRELGESLKFELLRHMPSPPADCRISFAAVPAGDDSGEVDVRCYACDGAALAPLTETVAALGWKPDGFVYPLMAMVELPAGAAVALPELGGDFFRRDGEWLPMESAPAALNDALGGVLGGMFRDGFLASTPWLAAEMVAVAAAAKRPARYRANFELFPAALSPRRFRSQVRLAGILLAVWVAVGGWYVGREVWNYLNTAGELNAGIEQLNREIDVLRRQIRQGDRTHKEQQRILEQANGDARSLERLALLAGVVPDDVMLSQLRATDTTWELTFMTESTEVNMGNELRRLAGCRLTNLQERSFGDSIRLITARLVWDDNGTGG